MFRQCLNNNVHDGHYWKPWNSFRRKKCQGIGWDDEDLNPWVRANPSIGIRTKSEIADDLALGRITVNKAREALGLDPIKHKHLYRVKNKVLVTPAGVPVNPNNIYWQCSDSRCWDIVSRPRDVVQAELLRKQVEQSWPM